MRKIAQEELGEIVDSIIVKAELKHILEEDWPGLTEQEIAHALVEKIGTDWQVENDCRKCKSHNLCKYRSSVEQLLDVLEKESIFTEEDTDDNTRREFYKLLARWCYWYDEMKI